MKPPTATLRISGYIVATNIDDLVIFGFTFQELQECVDNIMTSLEP